MKVGMALNDKDVILSFNKNKNVKPDCTPCTYNLYFKRMTASETCSNMCNNLETFASW